jgi:hypothetical protein
MPRPVLALLALALAVPVLTARDPKPDSVEQALALQKAMAAARQYLGQNLPAEAVTVLEAQLGAADGNRAFLALLRDAYTAELKRLETSGTAEAPQVGRVRRKLELLGNPGPTPPEMTVSADAPPAAAPAPAVEPPAAKPNPFRPNTAPPPTPDMLPDADTEFRKGNFALSEEQYALAVAGGGTLSQKQLAAYAYCRVKIAADVVNGPKCDAAAANKAMQDVANAMQLAPDNAALQTFANDVLAAARRKGGATPAAVATAGNVVAAADGWEVVETPSFRVKHKGTRAAADAVAQAAEAQRKAIFDRWSGPPAGAWVPKCEVVLHPTRDAYAAATKRPATDADTGFAVVRLTGGQPSERRVELRADDPGVAANALPRELTHVVLADLFTDRPPPKWAEEGMAVLAGAPEEVGRYFRTLAVVAQKGGLLPVAVVLDRTDFPPAAQATGFYCASVSLVDFLVRQGGEKRFTLFLRDCHRYGTTAALKRQYNLDGPAGLEAAWKRATAETARGPGG